MPKQTLLNLRALVSSCKDDDIKENRKKLRREFNKLDVDGDGKIEKEEFAEAFERLGWNVSRSVLRQVVDELDDNGDGVISFSEFIGHLGGEDHHELDTLITKLRDRVLARAQKYTLQRCFDEMDSDGDGKIDKDEFYDGIRDYGLHFTRHEKLKLWKEFDVSHDGQISYHEFWTAVTENWSERDYEADRHVKSAIRKLIRRHRSRSYNTTEVVTDLFDAMDRDHDGKVDMDEFGTTRRGALAKALYHAMSGISEMQKRRIFYRIDKSGDGTISLKELKSYVGESVAK